MSADRIDLPRLRAALGRHYGVAPDLCCMQQVDDAVRTQSLAWDLLKDRAAGRIVPPEAWTLGRSTRYGQEWVDDCGNAWWIKRHDDGTYRVVVHTPLDGEWKYTKKAEQRAARSAAKICKQLQSRRIKS